MQHDRRQRWPAILFFSFSGIVFAVSLYLVTFGATSPAASPRAATPTAVATAAGTRDLEVVLERDKRMRLGDLEIVYRGTHDRELRLDVIMLELDPDYAYRRTIDLATADRGFRLGGVALRLLSARKSQATILWNRES